MRNKNGSASPFRWMLKRYFFLVVAVTVITFAVFPMQGTMRVLSTRQMLESAQGEITPSQRAYYTKELTLDYVYSPLNLEILCILLGGTGFGAALVLFRHLFSRKRSMMIAALPQTRSRDFLRRAAVYGLWCLAPTAMCLTVHPLMVRANGLWAFFDFGVYLQRAGTTLLINLYGFTLGVLCASLFGTFWSAALGALLAAGSAEVLLLCWTSLAGAYLSTLYSRGAFRRLIRLSPVYTLYKGFYTLTPVSIWPGIAAILLFALLGWAAYCRTKPEHAGHTVSQKRLEPVLLGWTVLLGGTAGAMLLILYLTREPLMYAGVILGAAVVWQLTRMLLDQRIHLSLQKWKVPAAVTALLLAVLLGLRMDLFGYDAWAPEIRNLAAVSTSVDIYREEGTILRFEDSQSVQAAADWTAQMRKEMLEERRKDPFRPYFSASTIVGFTDIHGRTETRQYRYPKDQQAVLPALRVMAPVAERQKGENFSALPRASCYPALNNFGIQGTEFQQAFGFSMEVEQLDLNAAKIQDALRQDLQARTLDTLQQPPLLRLYFEGTDPATGEYAYQGNYTILKGDRNVLAEILGADAEKWIDYAEGGFAREEGIRVFLCDYEPEVGEDSWRLSSWKMAESEAEAREWMTHVTCCEDSCFRMPVDPSRKVKVYGLKRLKENLRYREDLDLDLQDPDTLQNLPSFEDIGGRTYEWILGEEP